MTLLVVLTSLTILGEITMPKELIREDFSVVGIEVRMTNAKEADAAGEIPKQWQKFFQDGIQQKIPGKGRRHDLRPFIAIMPAIAMASIHS